MADPIRTYIGRDWQGGHRLTLVKDQARLGQVDVLAGFEWVTYSEGEQFDPQAGISRADQLIQSIVNSAWEAGFRPAGYSDVRNETAALREHRDDLRKIAFHKLGIKKET
jgi:hypothetical protein